MVTSGNAVQAVGVALLVAGAVWMVGAVALVVAGGVLLVAPEAPTVAALWARRRARREARRVAAAAPLRAAA